MTALLPFIRSRRGLIVDSFAGCGGASIGLEAATGFAPNIAINHWDKAIEVHTANHPTTTHYRENVWRVDPKTATRGQKVWIFWASPDCTHFSNAKGSAPKSAEIRGLAWVLVDWLRETHPELAFMENVREFLTWGPLYPEGTWRDTRGELHDLGKVENPPRGWKDMSNQPIPERAGEDFDAWCRAIRALGYSLDWRVLNGADFGAPQARRRLFFVMRRDGLKARWPKPTHGDGPGLKPYTPAWTCIDFTLPCPSIFLTKAEGAALGVKRPLADNTLARIARGVRRFVQEAKDDERFIIPIDHAGAGDAGATSVTRPLSTIIASNPRHALVVPTLVQTGYGERPGQRPRYLDIQKPLGTVVAGGPKHALVAAFLAKHNGNPRRADGGGGVVLGRKLTDPFGTVTTRDTAALVSTHLEVLRSSDKADRFDTGRSLDDPMPTITAQGKHVAQVCAFLMNYNSMGDNTASCAHPMRTVTTKDRLSLVTVEIAGSTYAIVDIGMRMLKPHELQRAQMGRYNDRLDLSLAETAEDKVALLGNSVQPEVAEALVGANL